MSEITGNTDTHLPFSFADLVGTKDWLCLPAPVRRRFSHVFTPGTTHCYTGEVRATRFSRVGWCLAQICRLIGSPLPLTRDIGPAIVAVTDHGGNEGQVWSRLYHRPKGFAQPIQSVKRFAGPTGLEEYLGYGLVMSLSVARCGDDLEFSSVDYAWTLGGLRVPLPGWLSPGTLRVRHVHIGETQFDFDMTLVHPLFGELIYQRVRFNE